MSILGVGQTGLAAAQVGIQTTGHNITNASTAGYNRQVVVQTSGGGEQTGAGFLGQGTNVASIQRVFDAFTASRVNTSQSSKAALDIYNGQITQIDNLFADPSTGLSPSLQDFFGNLQGLAANPSGAAQRQTFLSSAQSLSSRFKSLDGQLAQISEGLNQQISGSVTNINSYAQQIAKLNDSIEKATANGSGAVPNDLLDQRDQVVAQLSKEVKVTVSDQAGSGYSVSIGNGQPVVVGTTTFTLKTIPSLTDQSRLQVGYQSGATLTRIPESAISGGNLGGLFDFRANSLDGARNELGRVAAGFASQVNDQSRLGIDLNGKPGKDIFNVAAPLTTPSSANTGTSTLTAAISDATALTASDYRVAYDGTNYQITRLKDNTVFTNVTLPNTLDGLTFTATPGAAVGDNFLVRPTVNAASAINLLLTDKSEIAAAAPIVTAAGATVPSTNAGNGQISAGSVDASYVPLAATVTLTYNAGTPATPTTPATPATLSSSSPAFSQNYVSGQPITFNGITFSITGAPVSGDKFTIAPNISGVGDGRNAVALAALQTAKIFDGKSNTFAGAFGLLVSNVGNKTHEVAVNAAAEAKQIGRAHV